MSVDGEGKEKWSIRKPAHTLPGDDVSVDQIVKRIRGCTTFVDHASDNIYVHRMKDLTLDETLLAEEALEKLMAQAGRTIIHYHADNGCFADNGFIDAVNKNNQRITLLQIT